MKIGTININWIKKSKAVKDLIGVEIKSRILISLSPWKIKEIYLQGFDISFLKRFSFPIIKNLIFTETVTSIV